MQAYLKFSRILTAVLLPLSHIDTAPVVEPYAPPTGDVNFGIIAAIVCCTSPCAANGENKP